MKYNLEHNGFRWYQQRNTTVKIYTLIRWEASMFWYMYPELTHMENFKMNTNIKKLYDNPTQYFYREEEKWQWTDDLSITASPELGVRCLEVITDYLVEKILACLGE